MRSNRFLLGTLATAALLTLAACGGGGDSDDVTIDLSNDRGSIQRNPPTLLAERTNVAFTTALRFNADGSANANGQAILELAGVPPTTDTAFLPCGVDVRYLQYGTVGSAGEKTNASGVLYLPTGAGCTGPRPIVLHAHGTTTAKDYNLALLGSTNAAAGETTIIAAMYAAKGMIVVAPNYAGYEQSSLGYHPYLHADQQSKDMIDALTAARKAIAKINGPVSDNGKLLLTGYSQGAHVAMATARALRAAGQPVTALAGGSGPYALAAFADDIFRSAPETVGAKSGPIVGGTLFAPLLTNSWQRAYGNLYTSASELYNATWATGIESLLPTTLTDAQLFGVPPNTPKLPQAALFDADLPGGVVGSPFYGATTGSGLIKTSYAAAVQSDIAAQPCATGSSPATCTPAHPLRVAAKANDLRTGWQAGYLTFPIFMCGGADDPTVYYSNTERTQAYFLGLGMPAQFVRALDLKVAQTGDSTAITNLKAAFQARITRIATEAGANALAAVAQNYHATVAPFCSAATAGFFSQVLNPPVP
ncbi:alpha/beta hydrolase family protein [Sphaerotilus mobilis]|uniref:Secretory lipase n=1 Tax=Sphaerotilus mobilis TaxID=47994 RepID=A0A4Q7LSX0_9BURK|nr:lipase family protein [Sphaerotilus mobilis]RZS56799.1 secretory lipase [Sphaerotilus mobilis]